MAAVDSSVQYSAAYTALKAKVINDPLDWTSWTALLGEADSIARTGGGGKDVEDMYNIEVVRDAYEAFLTKYPYCYGYWKKYAEHELKNGTDKAALLRVMLDQQKEMNALGGSAEGAAQDGAVDYTSADYTGAQAIATARTVYERGVAAVAHSVELWVSFTSFMVEHYTPAAARAYYATSGQTTAAIDEVTAAGWATHDIRSVFTRATEISALDPKAGQLWNTWVEWETKMANHAGVAAVYASLIASAAPYVETQWLKFKMYASFKPLHELYLDENDEKAVREHAMTIKGSADSPNLTENELRSAILTLRENIAKVSLAAAAMRKPFENALGKRTYFHVKPLDNGTLQAWRNYLDFEEQIVMALPAESRDAAALKRIEKLYGRCLVACANYAEFWIRYATWKLRLGGGTAAKPSEDVFVVMGQAITTFVPRRLDVQLFYCVLLEAAGKSDYASTYFQTLLGENSWCKDSMEVKLRFCNFLRRQGRTDEALTYLNGLIQSTTSTTTKSAIQAAYMKLWKLNQVASKGVSVMDGGASSDAAFVAAQREVFERFVTTTPSSSTTWLGYLDAERSTLLNGDVKDAVHLFKVYSRAAKAPMAPESLALVHVRWMDDADFVGAAVNLQEAIIAYRSWYAEYTGQLVLQQASTVDAGELVVAASAPAVLQSSLVVEPEEQLQTAGRKRGLAEAGLTSQDATQAKVPRTDESPQVDHTGGFQPTGAQPNPAAYPNYYGAAAYGSGDAASQAPVAGQPVNPYAAYGAYGYGYQQAYPAANTAYGGYPAGGQYRPYGY